MAKMFVYALPLWERSIYWICGISSAAYCVYSVFQEGEKNKDKLHESGFTDGWSWIGREKDDTNYGLRMWKNTMWLAMPWNVIHILLSQACRYFQVNSNIRTLLVTIVDVSGLCYLFGTTALIFLLALPSLMYMIIHLGRISLIWVMALALMIVSMRADNFIKASDLGFRKRLLFAQYLQSLCLVSIKFVSFGVEKIRYRENQTSTKKTDSDKSGELTMSSNSSSNKTTHLSNRNSDNEINVHPPASEYVHMNTVDSDPSYLDFLFYLFYYPTFFWGPFYDYCSFHNQVRTSFKAFIITENICNIIKQLIKLTFWLTIVDFQFHFLYAGALAMAVTLLEDMSAWTLVGIVYCQSCYFITKYIIIYGINIQLSRFDGLAPLPSTPCFYLMYSVSDCYRRFDVGLYTFFKKYIFIPFGGSKRGFLMQFIPSGLCFLVAICWHGVFSNIFMWSVGNYIICVIESVAITLDKSSIGVKMKSKLRPAMILRMKALLYYPLYTMGVLTGCYFFFDLKVGWIMFSKLLFQASWLSLATQCFVIISNIHIAIYFEELYKHRNKHHAE